MITEPIDLKALNRLIDNVKSLQSEVTQLTTQLQDAEAEKAQLHQQLSHIQSGHDTTVTALKQSVDEQLSTAKASHEAKLAAVVDEYEAKLVEEAKTLQEQNTYLRAELEQLTSQNQAMISRIRGIEV